MKFFYIPLPMFRTLFELFALLIPYSIMRRRFQFFNKLGVKFYDLYLFLRTERLQRTLNQFTLNLPLDFSEIFSISELRCFSSFLRIRENFRKNLKLS